MFCQSGCDVIQNLYLFSFTCSMLIELVCNAGAMKKEILHVKFATRLANFFFRVHSTDSPTLVQQVSL
jgi:hypothetical protein